MKSYTSIIVFFCAKKRPFWGFCALSVEPAVINGSVGGVVDGENEVYGVRAAKVFEIEQPVFRQNIAVACENAAFAEQNMENAARQFCSMRTAFSSLAVNTAEASPSPKKPPWVSLKKEISPFATVRERLF